MTNKNYNPVGYNVILQKPVVVNATTVWQKGTKVQCIGVSGEHNTDTIMTDNKGNFHSMPTKHLYEGHTVSDEPTIRDDLNEREHIQFIHDEKQYGFTVTDVVTRDGKAVGYWVTNGDDTFYLCRLRATLTPSEVLKLANIGKTVGEWTDGFIFKKWDKVMYVGTSTTNPHGETIHAGALVTYAGDSPNGYAWVSDYRRHRFHNYHVLLDHLQPV